MRLESIRGFLRIFFRVLILGFIIMVSLIVVFFHSLREISSFMD